MKRSLAPITTEQTSFALLLQLIVVSSFQLTQMDCSFYTICAMDTFYNHCIIKLAKIVHGTDTFRSLCRLRSIYPDAQYESVNVSSP